MNSMNKKSERETDFAMTNYSAARDYGPRTVQPVEWFSHNAKERYKKNPSISAAPP